MIAVVRDVDGHSLNSIPSVLVSTYVSQDSKHLSVLHSMHVARKLDSII